ncbi:hypothetical protein BN8_04344 [Fibrisoma limi BUZ 3]|uniref:Copper-binding protein MbnP-like domain-containing protein n=1 Tax=Fibrisoma limi BUZ 3 TaxID=1185876 RepID=I2GMI1_9BACT|nr:MbnP family protein [Fibrisoma limi]CCH55109.1 hypothetical protein BN8_04344 [Fibrisoma limi BUZ 3]
MRNFCYFMLALLLGVSVWACNDPDPEFGVNEFGRLQLVFDNVVGTEDLRLQTGIYNNAAGEQFSVSLLNYFVSNVRLKRADGSEYVVPQDSSYFLIKEAEPASQTVTITNVPAGDYVGVSYLIGVDSLRSTMDISRRKGVLEPAGAHNGGMYWDWNSGYIFFKLEGVSPQAPVNPAGTRSFVYHVGFFGGYETKTINNLRTATLSFGSDVAQVSATNTPRLTIRADILRVFDGAQRVSIAQNNNVMVSPFSATIASNYANMFQYSQPVKTN